MYINRGWGRSTCECNVRRHETHSVVMTTTSPLGISDNCAGVSCKGKQVFACAVNKSFIVVAGGVSYSVQEAMTLYIDMLKRVASLPYS